MKHPRSLQPRGRILQVGVGTGARLVGACAIAALFYVVARTADPTGVLANQAVSLDAPIRPPVARVPLQRATGRSLGSIEGPDGLRVLIYSGEDEARYTILNKAGDTIAERLLAEEVYRLFPDLDLASMLMSSRYEAGPGPLMMVDDASE